MPRLALLLIASAQPAWKHEVSAEYSFSLLGLSLSSSLNITFFCPIYTHVRQKKTENLESIWSSLKTKGFERGAQNLFRCQGQFCLVLKQRGRKK